MSGGAIQALLHRLFRERKGAALPVMAAALIPLMGGIGTAVDVGRIYLIHHQLQAGVDAAALAGARAFGNTTTTDASRERQVAIYFDENFPVGFLGTPAITPERNFEVVAGVNVTTVTARVDLPMTFMRLFGFSTHLVEVRARAELQPRPIEVMVVLDDTGSMQTKDVEETKTKQRMDALKTAMHDFISVLHQGASSRAELAMGFVTYNVTTNVGAILQKYHVAVEPLDGYTNVGNYTGGSSAISTNPLAWRGCVDNDASLVGVNISSNPTIFEPGAWDISRSLPGETVEGVKHPPVRPYLYPPNAVTVRRYTDSGGKPATETGVGAYKAGPTTADQYDAQHYQSEKGDGRTNNYYRLGPKGDIAIGQALANTPAYRQYFYDFYIGLNANATNPDDDVIVTTGGGYYAPGSGSNWMVNYSRLPFLNDDTRWGAANGNFGYPLNSKRLVDYPGVTVSRSGATLRMPSPNYQCPEPGMDVQYGRAKQVYDDYIDSENFPVMPASGTLHHIGMLWGYRLLTRDDVFTRVNPIPGETPLRALVFMTDGETAVDEGRVSWYSSYGALREKRIMKDATAGSMTAGIMRRFAKVCERAKQDDIKVYIVALKKGEPEFSSCAGSRYWLTTDQTTIRSAFNEIAVDLVDLHLTR